MNTQNENVLLQCGLYRGNQTLLEGIGCLCVNIVEEDKTEKE